MKHEKPLTVLLSALLAFAAAWGAVGCLDSAFALTLAHPARLALWCAGAAFLWAILLCLPRGEIAAACLLALGAGYLYHDGRAAQQFLNLVNHLSRIYDRAYGWGVLLPELTGDGPVDFPLGIWGILIALSVAWCVCRQGSVWMPLLATVLPLCSCIVVTDTVPGEVWLLAVLFSLILLILTTSVRRENPTQGLRLLLGAALPVLAGLLWLFLAVPQKNYVNHSAELRENILSAAYAVPQYLENRIAQLAAGLKAQPSRQVNLAQLGERYPLSYAVMEVTAQESGALYLREQDFDLYDGRGWTASSARQEVFPGSTDAGETITIQCIRPKALQFLPYYPENPQTLTGGGVKNPPDTLAYTLRRSSLPPDWRQTAYGEAKPAQQDFSRYLALPEATRKAGEELLAGWFSQQASNTEKADLLAAYVTQAAEYDLNPSRMPEDGWDFALWFLTQGERGYCVHFATAATVLLRCAGIPARYVTGYLVEAEGGKAVTVTEENAHAWAEYYEPNLGLWIPLDATPAQPEEETIVLRPTEETTAPTIQPTVPETIPETAAPPLPETTVPTEPVPVETPTEATEPPILPVVEEPSFPVAVLFLPVLLLIPEAQRGLRRSLRRQKQRTGAPNGQALHRWQEAQRLARLLGEEPPEELTLLAQKAKFSQHTLTKEELQTFDSYCRSCTRRLREKPWYLQWVYRYIYAID